MKKTIYLLFTAILLSANLFAQDRIVKNDKTEIKAKVLEVLTDEVKYKEYDNLEGPTYSMKKTDISVVIYSNGKVETFAQQTTSKQVDAKKEYSFDDTKTIMAKGTSFSLYDKNNYQFKAGLDINEILPVLNRYTSISPLIEKYKKAKTTKKITNIFFYATALGGFGYAIATKSGDTPVSQLNSTQIAIIGGLVTIGIIDLAIAGPNLRKKAKAIANKFNEENAGSPTTLKLKFNSNGLGLALNF